MWAGTYTLDLYCDQKNEKHVWDEFPHEYVDEFGSVCRARAKRAGWVFHLDQTVSCPKCSGKKSTK